MSAWCDRMNPMVTEARRGDDGRTLVEVERVRAMSPKPRCLRCSEDRPVEYDVIRGRFCGVYAMSWSSKGKGRHE